ncbi:hypothetical protein DSM106972_048240 [Dulcicalothrix desertica PCC 7102]|uniref:Uncharacterized protein n=1 Tax=Dulcicalothrix desertica PCC 7102 TaxID=232991 RepID=A0A433VCS1_9CYAN|nr:hypothetical protein DSM106972_048240 [Dulcicalothrix desertica PCC 7102]
MLVAVTALAGGAATLTANVVLAKIRANLLFIDCLEVVDMILSFDKYSFLGNIV